MTTENLKLELTEDEALLIYEALAHFARHATPIDLGRDPEDKAFLMDVKTLMIMRDRLGDMLIEGE